MFIDHCAGSRAIQALTVGIAVALAGLPASVCAQTQLPRPSQLPPAGGAPAAAPRPAPQAAPQSAPQQAQPQGQQPAPAKPYQPVSVKPPQPVNDPSFEAFRKQLADIVARKDRAALQKLVVAKGFFWEGDTGDKINKKQTSFANFAAAIGLNDKDGAGWDILAAAAAETTLEPVEERKGVMCGPASPQIDEKAFEALIKATGTDSEEWGFPRTAGIDVRGAAQKAAPVIETLGMYLVRVMPDDGPVGAPPPALLRVATPSGKIGFVPIGDLLPVVFDQMCYMKETAGWKIIGYASAE